MRLLWRSLLALLIALLLCLGLAGSVGSQSHDYELADVMVGRVVGLSVSVTGGGLGGGSIYLHFANNAGRAIEVGVPNGVLLVPVNSSVPPDMLVTSYHSFSVPSGESDHHLPSTPQWNGEPSEECRGTVPMGGNAFVAKTCPQPEHVYGIAGVAATQGDSGLPVIPMAGVALATAAALLVSRLTAGAAAGQMTAGSTPVPGSGSGVDGGVPPRAPGDRLPPPEWQGLSGFTDLQQGSRGQQRPNINPPVEIAPMPPPEDPANGVMIASSEGPTFSDSMQALWQWIRNQHSGDPEEAERWRQQAQEGGQRLRGLVNADETGEATALSQLQDLGLFRPELDQEAREAQRAADSAAGQRAMDNPAFGSASELDRVAQDPVRYAEEGGGDDIAPDPEQVRRERVSAAATEFLRYVRRLETLRSLINVRDGARDFSGLGNLGIDLSSPDAKDLIDWTGVFQQDQAAHATWAEFKRRYGRIPDVSLQDRDLWNALYRELKAAGR